MSTVENKSKRYQSLLKDLDQTKSYKIDEAVNKIDDVNAFLKQGTFDSEPFDNTILTLESLF